MGAQIGIHNPRGERVEAVSHLRNREYLFFVGPDARARLETRTDDVTRMGSDALLGA